MQIAIQEYIMTAGPPALTPVMSTPPKAVQLQPCVRSIKVIQTEEFTKPCYNAEAEAYHA